MMNASCIVSVQKAAINKCLLLLLFESTCINTQTRRAFGNMNKHEQGRNTSRLSVPVPEFACS